MKSYTIPLALFALSALALAVVLLLQPFNNVNGAAFTGQNAQLQFATSSVVGPQDADKTIFNDSGSNGCKSRVVSTWGGSAIMINFGDPAADRVNNISSTTVSGSIGHWQAASTTVAYDGAIYGCGRWSAYAYATQTLTVSEF